MQTKTLKAIQLAIAIIAATFVRIGIFDFLAIPPGITIFSNQFEVGPRLLSAIIAACVGGVIYYILGRTEVFRRNLPHR
jgi:membrane protein DedA with SNARE-associated domain